MVNGMDALIFFSVLLSNIIYHAIEIEAGKIQSIHNIKLFSININ